MDKGDTAHPLVDDRTAQARGSAAQLWADVGEDPEEATSMDVNAPTSLTPSAGDTGDGP
jgi:hypothetical protein